MKVHWEEILTILDFTCTAASRSKIRSSFNFQTTALTASLCACHYLPCPGVAVWRQHGGPPLRQGGAHRAHQEALQQRHRLLRQAKCAARRRGLDGRVQIPRLHGLEHPHERRSIVLLHLPLPPGSSLPRIPLSLARLFMQTRSSAESPETPVDRKIRNSDFIPLDLHTRSGGAEGSRRITSSRQIKEVRRERRARGASCLISLFSHTSL